jgi:hypothetical protein
MRATDFWTEDEVDGREIFNLPLIRALRAGPVPTYSDIEAALALADLLRGEFNLFGTSGGESLTDAGAREAMRTLQAITKRVGVSWQAPWRDFKAFYGYWTAHGGYGSWAARRKMVAEAFDPLIETLEDREEASFRDELANPISPKGRTGWERVDLEIHELRRHFDTAATPMDYRNIGNDVVAVLEALSEAAYVPARHLRAGETEPRVTETKNRLGRIIEVDGAKEGSTELVRMGKALIEFAQAVKHNPNGSRKRAGIAADAVIQLANMVRRLQT